MKRSFYLALMIAFIDLMSYGMIFPLFSPLIFDLSYEIVPASTSNEMRGIYLGILIMLAPLTGFFASPIWGALSDQKGRRSVLLLSQAIGLLGYLTAIVAVTFKHLYLLFLARVMIGIAAGNESAVQATIADLSDNQNKARYFGLHSMACGIGFTFGPFMSGALLHLGYAIPFCAAAFIFIFNLILTFFLFRETHVPRFYNRVDWKSGFLQLKKVFKMYGLRTLIIACFIHNFAWSYFFEFSPIYLIQDLHFTASSMGLFYGIIGGLYALGTGVLIRPFLSRFKSETLFWSGNILTGLILLVIPLTGQQGLWALLFPLCFFISFVSPTSTALISNHATSAIQGEALGLLSSVNAAALILSPLCASSFVGKHPIWVFWIGGSFMILSGLIYTARIYIKK